MNATSTANPATPAASTFYMGTQDVEAEASSESITMNTASSSHSSAPVVILPSTNGDIGFICPRCGIMVRQDLQSIVRQIVPS